jgi:hypothetical protein
MPRLYNVHGDGHGKRHGDTASQPENPQARATATNMQAPRRMRFVRPHTHISVVSHQVYRKRSTHPHSTNPRKPNPATTSETPHHCTPQTKRPYQPGNTSAASTICGTEASTICGREASTICGTEASTIYGEEASTRCGGEVSTRCGGEAASTMCGGEASRYTRGVYYWGCRFDSFLRLLLSVP